MLNSLTAHLLRNKVMYLLTLLAAVVCFWNIGFGAIQSIYPDETFFDLYAFKIIDYIRGNGIDYQLDPSVYSFCLAIAFGCYFVYGLLIGQFHSIQDFIIHFSTHREDFIVISRMVSAFFAVASVPFTYKIAEKLFNRNIAGIAAAALVISYPVVWFAHTAHHTTLSIFISVVILYFAIRVRETGSWKDYLLCGISIGMGIGVKLYPAMFALSLVIIHFQRNPLLVNGRISFSNFSRLFLAGLISLPATVIAYPWPFIEYHTWSTSIEHSNVFFTGGNTWTNLYYVLWGKSAYYHAASAEPFSFWSNSLRILSETSLVMILTSIVYLLYKSPARWLILILPFVLFMLHHVLRGGLAMGARQFYFLLPTLYISLALLLNDLSQWVVGKLSINKAQVQLVSICIVAVFFIQPAYWLARYLVLTSHPTTQEIGRDWITGHLGKNDLLLVNYAAPFSNIASWYTPNESGNAVVTEARKKQLPPFGIRQLEELDYQQEIAAEIPGHKTVYVALSDYNSTVYYQYDNARLWGEHKYHKFIQKTAYFNQVYRHGVIVKVISPAVAGALGPAITIYKMQQ